MASPPPPPSPEDGAVAGGAIAGAVVTIVLWILEVGWQLQVPSHVASAFTIITVAIGAWIEQKRRRLH